MTINSVTYEFADLPYNVWADEGSTFTYLYEDIVSSSNAGKRFKLASVSGPTSPFTVTGPVTVTGSYKVQYQITFEQVGLDSSATGTVVTVNGNPISYDSLPFSEWIDEGTTVTYEYESTVSSSISGKRFMISSVTGPSSPFTVNTPTRITGNYITQYYLTVNVDPAGITTISGKGWYNESETVTLTAPTVAGYEFNYWDVDGTSQGTGVNPIDVSMDSPHTATAHYTAITPQYTLTIITTTGGTTDPSPGSYTYDVGTVVSVTATPEADYRFDHWELDGAFYSEQLTVEVTMDSDHELKAFFEYSPSLSVSISPSSATLDVGGSVTFTASVSGGVSPYSYQWYVNGEAVPGATSQTWTFTPTASGIYYIHVVVTDSELQTAQSSPSRIVVQGKVPTVGGKVSPIIFTAEPENSAILPITITLTLLGITICMFIGKKKLRKSR